MIVFIIGCNLGSCIFHISILPIYHKNLYLVCYNTMSVFPFVGLFTVTHTYLALISSLFLNSSAVDPYPLRLYLLYIRKRLPLKPSLSFRYGQYISPATGYLPIVLGKNNTIWGRKTIESTQIIIAIRKGPTPRNISKRGTSLAAPLMA